MSERSKRFFFKKTPQIITLSRIQRVCLELKLPPLSMEECWKVRAGQPPRGLTLAQNYTLRSALRNELPPSGENKVMKLPDEGNFMTGESTSRIA